MSKVLKVLYTYNNRMKPLPQYVHTDKVMYCSGFFLFKVGLSLFQRINSKVSCNSNF